MRYFVLVLIITTQSFAQNNFGEYATAIFLQINQGNSEFYSCSGSGSNKINGNDFTGNLGVFERNSGDLRITGGEIKSWRKDVNANTCGGNLHYVIYKKDERPRKPTFSSVDLSWKIGCNWIGWYSDGYGPCSENDIKWKHFEKNINLTRICPGTYTLEIYFSVVGSNSSEETCDKKISFFSKYRNYLADFTIIEKQPQLFARASKYTVEEGEEVQLFAELASSKYEYTYQWLGNSFKSNQKNPIIRSISAKQSGIYQVVATDPCGQKNISDVTLIVYPKSNKSKEKKAKPVKEIKQPTETVEPRASIQSINLNTQKLIVKEKEVEEVETVSRPVFSSKDKLIAAKKNSRTDDQIAKIDFENPKINLFINDYGAEDGDLVTVFYNNKIVVSQLEITQKGKSITLKLDNEAYKHELFFVAENLGKTPPNTAKVIIKVDNKTYKHQISTDEKSNAKFVFVKNI